LIKVAGMVAMSAFTATSRFSLPDLLAQPV